MARQGEQGATPPQQDRFIQEGDYWYYKTREGVNIGPFDSRVEAIAGCSEFIELASEDESVSSTLQQYSAV